MNTFGTALRLSIFGESHGPAIGITVDGLPPGTPIDLAAVQTEMQRRAPGGSALATARKEPDAVEILSGLHGGVTTGFPLCGVIFNRDQRSRDYKDHLRPGHADWTALLKYSGHADMRGGGHFSGRLTAPLVFAGALAKQALALQGAQVFGRITAIAGLCDTTPPCTPEAYRAVVAKPLPVHSDAAGIQMRDAVLAAKQDLDSVGGIVEAIAFGLPAGLGEPFFGSVESVAAALLFSVPAVKGVSFGDGFALATMRGSQANDPLTVKDGSIRSASNRNGGILGGITNGMPVIVTAAIKPTPSIAREQSSVDPATMRETAIEIGGRHDPCIVPRAVPVIEAALAISVLDCLLQRRGNHA